MSKGQKKGICPITDKRQFDETGAKISAEKFAPTSSNQTMRAYKCQFCDWWHLTHRKQV